MWRRAEGEAPDSAEAKLHVHRALTTWTRINEWTAKKREERCQKSTVLLLVAPQKRRPSADSHAPHPSLHHDIRCAVAVCIIAITTSGVAAVAAASSRSSFSACFAPQTVLHDLATLEIRTTGAAKRTDLPVEADVLVAIELLREGGRADVACILAPVHVRSVQVLLEVIVALEGEAADDADVWPFAIVDAANMLEEVGTACEGIAADVTAHAVPGNPKRVQRRHARWRLSRTWNWL
jgi:hypothetical protein